MLCTSCNQPVKPVVAVDIDGTLGDYHGHFLRFAADYLDAAPTAEWMDYTGAVGMAEHMGIPSDLYRQVKLAYRQGGMKRTMPLLRPFEDSAHIIREMRSGGIEVWVTTTRPYMRLDNVDPDTREWLRRQGIEYDGLLYDARKVEALVDIVGGQRIIGVVDDQPDIYDVADGLGLGPMLMRSRYNRAIRRSTMVSSMAAVQYLVQSRFMEWSARARV